METSPLRRIKLTIEYDGKPFMGWQFQDHGATVQGELERAVKAYTGQDIRIHGAGRTDAGVHATGQVAHFDFDRKDSADKAAKAINFYLKPHPIAVIAAEEVTDDFHSRFSATKRHYIYRIFDRPVAAVLDRDRVWSVAPALDAEAMHQAAQRLIGLHDFTTFRSVHCQSKSPVKTLERLDVSRIGDEIHIEASARSFLHNQIRSFVGSLRKVGEGKWSADDLEDALVSVDRSRCGPVAPPDGLYLSRVEY